MVGFVVVLGFNAWYAQHVKNNTNVENGGRKVIEYVGLYTGSIPVLFSIQPHVLLRLQIRIICPKASSILNGAKQDNVILRITYFSRRDKIIWNGYKTGYKEPYDSVSHILTIDIFVLCSFNCNRIGSQSWIPSEISYMAFQECWSFMDV